MTTLFLIRHAQAEGNLYRIAQGQFDSYITALGYKQIDALAERFKNVHLDALYSSDLRRTRMTATAITRYHDLEMHTTPRLREIRLGVCEGMSFGDMRNYDPVQMDYFNNDPEKWRAEGAETFTECTERLMSVITEIAEANDGKTVAVVSHGMAIRSMLARVMGVKSEDIADLPHGDNTAVTLLHYADGKVQALTNHNGGVTGGITNGMPLVVRVAIKPTIRTSPPSCPPSPSRPGGARTPAAGTIITSATRRFRRGRTPRYTWISTASRGLPPTAI